MKNLKKVLSLVLALAMALSLMTVAFAKDASDYTDYGTITNKEAVEVLTALNVIDGMGDSFQPNGNVTRAQMAKMITIISLGNVDPTAFLGTTTDLKDINGHWGEAYIKYCYSQGIISGRGNGIFDPNANVTTVEAAKMLLTAIGYNSSVQGYTGSQWKLNTIRDAQTSKFFDKLSLPADKALTRDEAAQMIYNAVQANTIVKTSSVDRFTGNIIDSYDPTGDPLLEETFNVVEVEETMTDSVKQLTGVRAGTYTVYINGVPYHSAATDFSALLGQEVVLMFQDKDEDGAQDNDEPVFGVYPKYTEASTAVMAQSGITKASDKSVKYNGETYTLNAASITRWTVAVDGDITTGTITAAGLEAAGSYDTVRLVDSNSDAKYDIAIIYKADAQKVTYVDSNKVIAGATTYTTADNVVAGTLAKDDYAALTWSFAEGKTQLAEIEKQSGTVTAIDETNDKAQVNGAWIYDAGNTNMSVDNSYDYYVLNGVLVYATQTTSADMSNLVFVSDVDTTTVNKEARVYYVDGTSKVIPVDQTSTGYVVPTAGGLYTVSETDYGFKFKDLASYTSYTNKGAIYTDYTYSDTLQIPQATPITNIGGTAIADDAVIFVTSGANGTAKVITGEQLKSLGAHTSGTDQIVAGAATESFVKTVNGLNKVTVATVEWNDSTTNSWTHFTPTSTANGYGIIVDTAIKVADGYAQYTIWNGTENVTVVDKTNTNLDNLTKFSVVEYSSVDADGYIKDAVVHTFDKTAVNNGAAGIGAGALTGYEKDSNGYYDLYIDGNNKFDTDNKTVYLYMNSAAEDAKEIGLTGEGVTLADKVYDQYCENMIVYADAAGQARVVVFDVTNRLALDASEQYTFTIAGTTGVTVKDADGNVLVSGTSKVKAGDLLTIEITGTTTSLSTTNAGDITDVAGNYADFSSDTVAAGRTYIAVVTGNVTVTVA